MWAAPRRTTRGGQPRYSDLAIELCLTLGLVFKQPLRQTQGLMRSIASLLEVEIAVPDFSISDAKRSFLVLQEACLLTRRDWENHKRQHFPALGSHFGHSMFAEPDETQHIRKIERTGSEALNELLASIPKSDALASSELHRFIAKAQSASTQIEQHKSGLEGPKLFRH